MTPATLEAAAQLAEARRARRPIGRLPERCRPADQAAAYAVQDRLHGLLEAGGHGPVAGHKIGCTTAVMQAYLGIDSPCAGGVFAATVQHGAGRFDHAALLRPGVECEIAVRLGRDLGGPRAALDRATVAAAVDSCMAAIELVDDRYEDYRALDPPTLIADDFFNAGCVLGAPIAAWQTLDLAALAGRMAINGRMVGTGRGGDILGHPLDALAWLAGRLHDRGRCLRAGEFVLLGSVVQTQWVVPGDLVEIELAGLGRASARF
jgi:2-oxo-3-hexenedioate decarboxylase/2-keto-4-pentenoate hydratase